MLYSTCIMEKQTSMSNCSHYSGAAQKSDGVEENLEMEDLQISAVPTCNGELGGGEDSNRRRVGVCNTTASYVRDFGSYIPLRSILMYGHFTPGQ